MEILRLLTISEDIYVEGRRKAPKPIRKVAAAAVIKNPSIGERSAENLEQYFGMGKELGYVLARAAMERLGNDGKNVESYGKACIIGVQGEIEQGAILIHKEMGVSVREVIGGGKAGIPSTKKVAPAGTSIDVPLSYRDDSGRATHFDSMSVVVPGAPNPDEIVVVLVLTNGGRPHPWEGWK
jgi:Protein of unknown function (DUF1185).